MNGLKFIRTRCNMSLNELADILDVSRQQVSAWENGVKTISQKRLRQLSEGIQEAMGYFGKPNKIIEEISAINRGCKVYDALTKYLRQMPNEDPGSIILYYNMARNVLFSLLIANGLMSQEELEKEFRYSIGSKLYDDMEWIYEIADIFKKRYDDKVKLIEEIRSNLK